MTAQQAREIYLILNKITEDNGFTFDAVLRNAVAMGIFNVNKLI